MFKNNISSIPARLEFHSHIICTSFGGYTHGHAVPCTDVSPAMDMSWQL